jgi:hypothetical protein
MGPRRGREERLDAPPENINNFRLECAHDGHDLHTVVGGRTALASNASHPDDRWMVTYPPRVLSLDPPMR